MYEQISRELMDFIAQSPSCFHVTANFARMLTRAGFVQLFETQDWTIVPGGNYFVTRGGSSLIALRVPANPFRSVQLSAAHSDSPAFRLKEHAELPAAGHYVQLNVEKYGGAILAPWLDRPLSVAGRVIVRSHTDDRLISRLVNIDRELVLIPNLAIHMNREINNGFAYQIQKDLLPVFGDETANGRLYELLCEVLNSSRSREEPPVTAEDIIGSDLFLYSRTPGCVWGANREFISSPKLDDLQCAYALIRALIDASHPQSLCAACIFDNEEVGSLTKQGADSTFLQDTLERINAALGYDPIHLKKAVASGFMISADNAHAAHPQHLEKADPVNRPYMNLGPVIKFSANQKYTSDAVSASVFRSLCRMADVPCQTFTNHSDVTGGSTLGNLSNAHVSIHAVDIGLPQLAMHSPYETAGVKDTLYLMQVMQKYYQTFLAFEEEHCTLREAAVSS